MIDIVSEATGQFAFRYTKSTITSVVVFGAGGRMGSTIARHIYSARPKAHIRLVTNSPEKVENLRTKFPVAEVLTGDYLDSDFMNHALNGMQGAFIVTPNFIDEQIAMGNFVNAAKLSGTLTHAVRVLGDPPSITMDTVPEALKESGGGTAMQHLVARKILCESGLPVTFLNCAAWYMDNFLTVLGEPIRALRKLIVPHNRWMMFIDPREIAEMAANIILSPNQLHIGQIYNLDNGHDLLTFDQVADVLSVVLGENVTYDDDPEAFVTECGPAVNAAWGGDHAARYFDVCFDFERDHETAWRRSDIGYYLLGREPKKLQSWLEEHRNHFI